jgi:hypothetical protein
VTGDDDQVSYASRFAMGGGMSVAAVRVRELALALPLASEAPHFDRLAFRTPRKIFATLNAHAGDLNLMFDPDLRDFYCEQAPHAFTPVPGGWGRRVAIFGRWTKPH